MKVELDLKKSLHENASAYYQNAKKFKKKLKGLEKALAGGRQRVESAKKTSARLEKPQKIERKRKKKWFEKFHWFFSSDGFLVIGGRDAKSNEAIVKNHMEKNDVYFHADIHGAPHTIIKTAGKKVPEKTLEEAAAFAAIHSSAWKQKLAAVDVYSAKPEQVSKKAPSGEALGTGAFMIYGKRIWYKKTALDFAIGLEQAPDGFALAAGPRSAVEARAKVSLRIVQGEEKKGAIAKKIKAGLEQKLGARADLDEIVSLLPAGGLALAKKQKT